MASVLALRAPTKIGAILTECLHQYPEKLYYRIELYITILHAKENKNEKGAPQKLYQDMVNAFPCYVQPHQHEYPLFEIF